MSATTNLTLSPSTLTGAAVATSPALSAANVTAPPVSGTPTVSVAPQTGPGVSSQSSLASITQEDIQAVRARSTISQARAPEAEVTGLFGGLPIFDQGPTRTSSVRDGVPTSTDDADSTKTTKAKDSAPKIPQEELLYQDWLTSKKFNA